MYKVMLVDDEREIRHGLRLKVDWEQLGLAVRAEAANGLEAMEKLREDPCDIVLTDMKMPLMNGVSFMEACSERFPSTRLVVVTGYDEFRYAQAAIRSNARDFLLKPIARNDLADTLAKVVRELDEERASRDRERLADWRYGKYIRELRDHAIMAAIKTPFPSSGATAERARLLQLSPWMERPVRFVTAGLARGGSSDASATETFRLPFEQLCREFAETSPHDALAFRDDDRPTLMHFLIPSAADSAAFIRSLAACIRRYLRREPAVKAGDAVGDWIGWRAGYLSALLAWNLPDGETDVPDAGDRHPSAFLPQETVRLLQSFLLRGRKAEFERLARKELSRSLAVSSVHFVKGIFQLNFLIESAAGSHGLSSPDAEHLWVNPETVWTLTSVDMACAYLFRLADALFRHDGPQRETSEHAAVKAIQNLIERHYMHDLNLGQIAERFSYNPSYLSDLFKDQVGRTFMSYLTDVRMAKARQLLEETDLGLSDIAELTGFSNASYFSSKFKKRYGIPPSGHRSR